MSLNLIEQQQRPRPLSAHGLGLYKGQHNSTSSLSNIVSLSAGASPSNDIAPFLPPAVNDANENSHSLIDPDALATALQDQDSSTTPPNEANGDESRLFLLDLRSFLAFNESHIISSHNVNIPGVLIKRLMRQKDGRTIVTSMFASDEGKIAFQQRSGKTVVVVDDPDNVQASNVLLDVLSTDQLLSRVCRLAGGFEQFKVRFPHLCIGVSHKPITNHPASPALRPQTAKGSDTPSSRVTSTSQVFPWLWMGNEEDAADIGLLHQLGIRYIVNAARECSNHHEKMFVYKNLAADDHIESPAEFESEVQEICRFIASSKKQGDGNVFVHCRAGVSRSATVVIAYLMQEERWSYEKAIEHVRTVRPCVSPNLGFLCLLMDLEKRLQS